LEPLTLHGRKRRKLKGIGRWIGCFQQQQDLLQMEVVNPTASEASGPADEVPETDAVCALLQEATESNQCTIDDTSR
jgi:hypothetical protein